MGSAISFQVISHEKRTIMIYMGTIVSNLFEKWCYFHHIPKKPSIKCIVTEDDCPFLSNLCHFQGRNSYLHQSE